MFALLHILENLAIELASAWDYTIPMKNLTRWIVGVFLLAIACYLSYQRGYQNGNKAECLLPAGAVAVPPPMEGIGKPQHHYEFKQNGASIYRFDLDTGEACWMQLSQADAGTPMAHCVVKP